MMWAAAAVAILALAGWDAWRRYLEHTKEARQHANALAAELKELILVVRAGQEKNTAAVANFLEQQRQITGYQLEKLNNSQQKLVASNLQKR